MTHETNYFIKEEVHDHRKATKLVMRFQSSEIKFACAILLRLLTLKNNLNAHRFIGDQKTSRAPLKKPPFCHLGIVTDPKKSLHRKNHAHTITTGLMSFKGLSGNN